MGQILSLTLGRINKILEENNLEQLLEEVVVANDSDRDVILDHFYYTNTTYHLLLLAAVNSVGTNHPVYRITPPSTIRIPNEQKLVAIANILAQTLSEQIADYIGTHNHQYRLVHCLKLSMVIELTAPIEKGHLYGNQPSL